MTTAEYAEKHPEQTTLDDATKVDKVIPISDSDSGLGAFTGINEKALLRKLDRKLLPAVTILYLLSFLDRSNGRLYPAYSTYPMLIPMSSRQRARGRDGQRSAHEYMTAMPCNPTSY